MKYLRLALVSFLSFGFGFVATVWADHQFENFHWNKLGIRVCNMSVDTEIHPYWTLFTWEWAQWSAETELHLVENCDEPDLVLTHGNYGPTPWIGHADMEHSGLPNQHITSGLARINEYYTDFKNDQCVQGVACHEIGHNLGLAHIGSASCMDPDWGAYCNAFNTDFDDHDKEMVNAINHCGLEAEP